MNNILDLADKKLNDLLKHLETEFSSIRAGRANPAILSNIKVKVYGQSMAIEQIANINVVDATLITIKPWDKSNIDEVFQAIKSGGIGVNPLIEGEIIKLPIPPMTEERRLEYVKVMRQKSEEARIAVRKLRREFLDDISLQKNNKLIDENEQKRLEKEIQTKIEKINTKIEETASLKEKELLSV